MLGCLAFRIRIFSSKWEKLIQYDSLAFATRVRWKFANRSSLLMADGQQNPTMGSLIAQAKATKATMMVLSSDLLFENTH